MKFSYKYYKSIWSYVSVKDKKYFLLIILLTILVSLIELVGVGAIFPYLKTIINPEAAISKLSEYEIILEPNGLIIYLTVIFLTTILISAYLRIKVLKLNIKYANRIGVLFNEKVYEKLIYQDYLTTIKNGGNMYLNSILLYTDSMINGVLIPSFTIINSLLMVFFYSILLIIFSSGISVAFIGLTLCSYLIIYSINKSSLHTYDAIVSEEAKNITDIVNNTIGGIRDVILYRLQKLYYEDYAKSERALRSAKGSVTIIASSARYLVEAIATTAVILIIYTLYVKGINLESYIPEFSLLILIAQRILPLMQHIYGANSSIKSNASTSIKLIEILESQSKYSDINNKGETFSFNREISLVNVNFKYPGSSKLIFENLNLKIQKGQTIGIIGDSGSGKSTLIDLLMGVIYPTSGYLKVDDAIVDEKNNVNWYSKISHVSQINHIFNKSLRQNISLEDKLDLTDAVRSLRLNRSLKLADLDTFIAGQEKGVENILYESGRNLSGGQRQRIALARAFYREAELMVLDESTSALDKTSEKLILKNIYSLKGVTKIIITHIPELLEGCEKIYKINNGCLYNVK